MVNASISVILPFRAAAETIDAALAGLTAESDPAREILAIDDGSTDGGAMRVRTWAARDPRVRLLANAGSGLVSALNTGLACARGELIARMDADDIAHPERLSRQRTWLVARPDIAVLGTCVRAVADDGNVGAGLLRYVAWQNAVLTPEQHALSRFVESPLCHPSIMLRRAVLAETGGYRELDGPEDYELFLRVVACGHRLAKLPEVLLHWRHREGRATFDDARYGLDKFRRVKAPYLAAVIHASARERVVLWGAGRTGRRLARELARNGVRIAMFIDIDPRKIGRTAQQAPICAPAALDVKRDLVIAAVGARGARALIRADLLRRGFCEGDNAWFAS